MNANLKRGLRYWLPRTARRHRIIGGPLSGSFIVTSWYDYPAAILGNTEQSLLSWFAANVKTGETWLDIGAHYGYTALALCKLVGESGRVFAFEPMLNTAGCICRTRSLNNLTQMTVIPLALGSRAELGVDSMLSVRGMIDSTLQDGDGFKESFMISKLDWLWQTISGPDESVHGIKIDVQGMEIDVLEGMTDLLKRKRPKLLVELHAGVSRSHFLEVIESCGYSPRATPLEPLPGETDPVYADRTYIFQPKES